jgi:hypothetical protein
MVIVVVRNEKAYLSFLQLHTLNSPTLSELKAIYFLFTKKNYLFETLSHPVPNRALMLILLNFQQITLALKARHHHSSHISCHHSVSREAMGVPKPQTTLLNPSGQEVHDMSKLSVNIYNTLCK